MNSQKQQATQEAALWEEVRRIASRYSIPVDMSTLVQWSHYIQGARQGIVAFASLYPELFKGKDGPYNKAVYDLVVSDLRHTDLFLSKEYEIRYRNHKRDKRGKLISCEAYFAKAIRCAVEVE